MNIYKNRNIGNASNHHHSDNQNLSAFKNVIEGSRKISSHNEIAHNKIINKDRAISRKSEVIISRDSNLISNENLSTRLELQDIEIIIEIKKIRFFILLQKPARFYKSSKKISKESFN